MKKLWWSTLCILLLFACTTPEKKAKKILDEFSKELRVITDVENLSAYDLSNCIDKAYARLEENQKKARKELKKAEQKELFDEAFDVNNVEIYHSLLEALTNKSLKSLEYIKGKWWINSENKDFKTIFKIDNHAMSFLNLEHKVPYEIVNGKIIFEEENHIGALFFELQDSILMLKKADGTRVKYNEAISIEDLVLGNWYGEEISLRRFHLEFRANNILTVFNRNTPDEPNTYKINGKKIQFNSGQDKWTITLPSDNRLAVDIAGTWEYLYFSRRPLYGEPKGLDFLFKNNDTQVKYTTSSNVTTTSSTSKSGNNWDSVLDDYEEYFDQYVKLLKKAKNGDVSALTEYAKMLEKAQSIGNKLERAKGDLTANQSARFLKIQQKLLNAASDL